MLWLGVLESIPSQWKRKMKSHDMKIVDDVFAGPSLNMTVKSAYNILLRSVKHVPHLRIQSKLFSTITALTGQRFI